MMNCYLQICEANMTMALKDLMLDSLIKISKDVKPDNSMSNAARTKHCWQNYVDYHKCILAKGEDFAPCRQVNSQR